MSLLEITVETVVLIQVVAGAGTASNLDSPPVAALPVEVGGTVQLDGDDWGFSEGNQRSFNEVGTSNALRNVRSSNTHVLVGALELGALTVLDADEVLVTNVVEIMALIRFHLCAIWVNLLEAIVGPLSDEGVVASVIILPLKEWLGQRRLSVGEGSSGVWTVRVSFSDAVLDFVLGFAILVVPDWVILELPVVGRDGARANRVTGRIVDNLERVVDGGMLGDDVVVSIAVVQTDVTIRVELDVSLSVDVPDPVSIDKGAEPLFATDEVDTTLNVSTLLGVVKSVDVILSLRVR